MHPDLTGSYPKVALHQCRTISPWFMTCIYHRNSVLFADLVCVLVDVENTEAEMATTTYILRLFAWLICARFDQLHDPRLFLSRLVNEDISESKECSFPCTHDHEYEIYY